MMSRPIGASLGFLLLVPLLLARRAGADVEDLSLVPANAQGFVSVRVAALWGTPAMRKALAHAKKVDPKCEDPAARLEKEFGLRPNEVERATAVYSDDGHAWVVVRTAKPFDERKLLARLKGAKQASHQGKRYHAGTHPLSGEVAVWFAGPRVVVAGSAPAVRRCIALGAGEAAKGPLQPILARCGGSTRSSPASTASDWTV